MKLGISFNVFDGIDILEKSIENIRPCTDHINIVYQNMSNHLFPAEPQWEEKIFSLNVNSTILYQPQFESFIVGHNVTPKQCHQNETNKRNIGKQKAKECGCTHFLSMDVDEFYKVEEVEKCKKIIEENKYDATACCIQEYVYKPTYRKVELESFFVSFIHDINLNFEMEGNFFVYVDPTRRPRAAQNPFLFDSNQIVLHHMTNVRKDKNSLLKKYRNSSAYINFKKIIIDMANASEIFSPDETIKIVDNEFNIHIN